jgi:hypothetical protein
MFSMTGSYLPFAREAVTERYRSKDGYLAEVRKAAQKLAADGYLLERDLPAIEQIAAREWDFVTSDR